MTLLQSILDNEVYPAMGCTEPISCGYACAVAADALGERPESLDLVVDAGTFKNGAAVHVPNSGGLTGNAIAACMGVAIADPAKKLEVLSAISPDQLDAAKALLPSCTYRSLPMVREFHVEATVSGNGHSATCVLDGGHTNIVRVERDGEILQEQAMPDTGPIVPAYRKAISQRKLEDLLQQIITEIDDDVRAYLRRGVEMNLAISEHGRTLSGTARQLIQMRERGILAADVFTEAKETVAAGVDARMCGEAMAVMTSGGSGNQGIVAILTPWVVGKAIGTDEEIILESLAIAHAVNAYIKSFTGELAVICGCAMAAGVAAGVAIVYQTHGLELPAMSRAVNNVIGDLSGLICDGAKAGCAMKTVTSVDSAIRSALMAIDGFGLGENEGLVGKTVEQSIQNLSRVSLEGMFGVDPTVLAILEEKALPNPNA
ncbi:MAG: serine dehydratase subunit alpha family protein [Phycisphaerales bacterium]|jgi:L-cysteine desulfidase|nr:serine dehydratase subunit alpha family protein [Phycisphaerales bacterium]MBT7171480.1 serine dehydratase subunit alpha family protein [Phycisphaerales bacterium]